MNKDDFNSLKDIEKDIILHPQEDLDYLDNLFNSNLFTEAEIKDINSALSLILNDEKLSEREKGNLLENSWKINHKFKVPTPQEFLDEKWIGPLAKDLFPHVIDTFCKHFDPMVNRNKLLLYSCTGYGKSSLVALAKYYNLVRTNSYRSPSKFLKLGKSSRITDITISFTKKTAFDLVLRPLINILETSPFCQRVHYERDMDNPEYVDSGKLLFCNTSKGNSMLRVGEIFMDSASSIYDLTGRNILQISMTECNFLSEVMSEDTVIKLADEMVSRVQNRFGYNNPNNSIIFDSSPNSMEGLMDQWMIRHKNDEDTLFINDKKWELPSFDWMFPQYNQDKKNNIFPIFKGTSTQPTKIITKDEVKNYNEDDILWTPIDLYNLAKDNVAKTMRDYGATPTAGSDTKLFTNHELIEKCFVPNLKNFYMQEYASYLLPPETLLWDRVRPLLYVYTGKQNSFRLKRYPSAPRFIHIDLAEKKDMAGITMVHLECDKIGRKMYVVDFSLPIMCKKEDKINLDSFKYLVQCMKIYGNTNIKKVTYDNFQSAPSIQFIERLGIECERLSLDNTPDYYLSFASWVMQGRVKMGRNLIMKNNLKSLVTTNGGHNGKESKSGKLIIDHVQGDFFDMENSDWKTSKAGYFGKDLADSLCGACANADESKDNYALFLYDDSDEKEDCSQKNEKKLQDELYEKFGLKFKKNN